MAQPKREELEQAKCPTCRRNYWRRIVANDADRAKCCGYPVCWAKAYWNEQQWEGHRDMALRRVEIGLELNELDRHSLQR